MNFEESKGQENCSQESDQKPHYESVFIPEENSIWLKYKTSMCLFVTCFSNCRNGNVCYDAHSELELRSMHDPIPVEVKALVNPHRTESYFEQVSAACLKRNSEISKLKYQLAECREERQILSNETQILQKEVEDSKSLCNSLQIKNKELECTLNNGGPKVDEQNRYSEVQQIESNNLKKELELSKEECVNLKTKIILLQKENEQICLHNNESVKECKEKDKEIKEISLQYQKNLESIDKLNKKCSKLQNSNLILQMNNDDLQVKLERVSHGYKSMHAKTLELESEKKKSSLETIMLKNDIKSKDEIIYNLMTDAYNAKNENNQNFYANVYNELISKLNELFQCPLSLDQIVIPVILPSGITITEGFFDVLKNRNDPYDKNMKITGKIYNRFARDVIDIVKNSKDAVFEEIKKIHKPDPKIEEEKEQISYHQPHENLNSNLDFSFIYNSPSHLNKSKSCERLKQTSHFNPPFNPFIYPPSHNKKH